MGNFSPWMGFELNKETIGDKLQTFFISAKLNLEKVEIILLNRQLCQSPTKTHENSSSISFTARNWNWFRSYCIGPGYNGRRHRWCNGSQVTICNDNFWNGSALSSCSVVWGVILLTLCTWNTYRSLMGNFVLRILPLRYTVKASSWLAMTMKLAYVYYLWHFLWTKKKVIFVMITSKACSDT